MTIACEMRGHMFSGFFNGNLFSLDITCVCGSLFLFLRMYFFLESMCLPTALAFTALAFTAFTALETTE